MYDAMRLIEKLPEMLSGQELLQTMQILPPYDRGICTGGTPTQRLMQLNDLYRVYAPSHMSMEVYSKLYLSILRSLQKKGTKLAVQQANRNASQIQEAARSRGEQQYSGIMGGADCFTIIGTSGIGKSSAIARALQLIGAENVIQLEKSYTKIIPCLTVQCPFDSSVKALLLEVLRKVDEELDTTYYKTAIRARATTDMLIGSVSQVCLNHIGLLVVDEIQNVVNSKNGRTLIGSLTQLINTSGISIGMVGTPESEVFFTQAMQLARRSLGLKYNALPYDEHFAEVCKILFQYQYIKHPIQVTDAIIRWLYEHSAGVISIVVSLLHDAQEQAILSGRERLDMEALQDAYTQRMGMLHSYINPAITRNVQSGKRKKKRLDMTGAKVCNKNIKVGSQDIEAHSQVSVPSISHNMSETEIQSLQPSMIHTLIDEARKNDMQGNALIDFISNYIQIEVIA